MEVDYNGDSVVNMDDLIEKQNEILNNIQELQNELKTFTECWKSQAICQ